MMLLTSKNYLIKLYTMTIIIINNINATNKQSKNHLNLKHLF